MRRIAAILWLLGAVCAWAQVKFNSGVKIESGVRISQAVMSQQVPALAQPIASGGSGATFAQANKVGNLIVVIPGWYGATADLASTAVTDSAGNTYAQACAATTTADNAIPRQAIYFAKNIAAYAANTVTVHWGSVAPSAPGTRIMEFSGLDQTSPFDACSAVAGTYTGTVPTTVTTNTVTTAVATELLVGGGTATSAFDGPGVNYQGQASATTLAEYRVVQAAGSYAADGVLSGHAQNWVMSLAAFKAAGQSIVQPPPTLTSVTPTSGTTAGGTSVTLAGTNFVGAVTVDFGGVAATNVNVVSSASITAVTPAHAAGVVDVTVTVPGASPVTLSGAFTYNAPPTSTDRYVANTGSDAAAGDQTHPWATLQYAVTHVPAGGTVHVAASPAGTYYAPVLIDCAAGATQGTAIAPITLISDVERAAEIGTPGGADPLKIQNCSYWNIVGFRAQDSDHTSFSDAVFYLYQTDHITLKRNLLRRANRYKNATLITVDHGSNTLVEENELYEYHKHGLIFYYGATGGRNIARRNYCNSRGYADITGGFVSEDPSRGDQCVQIYGESGDLLENNISEGQWHAFEIRPAGSARADNNLLYGNIAVDSVQGFTQQANSGSTQADDAHMPHNTLYKGNVDVAGYNTSASFSSESAKTATFDHNTALTVTGQNGFQVIRNAANAGDGTNSASFTRNLAMGYSSENGFYAFASAGTVTTSGSYVNAYGYTTAFTGMASVSNQTTSDPGLGACKAWRPDGSWAKTNDLGADVLYRYDNGTLTNVPLWADTGAFPGGVVVAGWNDVAGSSLVNLPARLNINTSNCPFPGTVPPPTSRTLSVTVTGSGTASTAPTGITNCSDSCSAQFNNGQSVSISATPQSGATFQGWGGDCLSYGTTSPCVLTMDANKTVSAGFSTVQTGPTYYLSAAGNDANAGTRGSPWRTFDHAIPLLYAGYQLIVMDGTYTGSNMLTISGSAGAHSGTVSSPITVKAENERGAWIKGDTTRNPVTVTGVHDWIIQGLRISDADCLGSTGQGSGCGNSGATGTVWLNGANGTPTYNVTIRRNLIDHSNRCNNKHLIALDYIGAHNNLVEENELYYFHRHGISTFSGSHHNAFRRNYANMRSYVPSGCAYTPPSGGYAYMDYAGNFDEWDNNIGESQGKSVFGQEPVGVGNVPHDNTFYGNVGIATSGTSIYAGPPHGASMPGTNNAWYDHVGIGSTSVNWYMRCQQSFEIEHLTLFATTTPAASYFLADNGSVSGCNPSGTINKSEIVVTGTAAYTGFQFNQGSATISNSGMYPASGHAISNLSVTNPFTSDPGYGNCRLWSPDGSNARNADVGATVLNATEGGSLRAKPLWSADSDNRFVGCGVIVAGVNDDASGNSCKNVQTRLNVGSANGCAYPAGYTGW